MQKKVALAFLEPVVVRAATSESMPGEPRGDPHTLGFRWKFTLHRRRRHPIRNDRNMRL